MRVRFKHENTDNLHRTLASEANAILTAFYETLVAILTLFRAIQEFRESGSRKIRDHGLFSLLIDQGEQVSFAFLDSTGP